MLETVKLQTTISVKSSKKLNDYKEKHGHRNLSDATDAFIQAAQFKED